MVAGTIRIDGRKYVVVPEEDYQRLQQRARGIGDTESLAMPARTRSGNLPALQALRVGLAEKLIRRRWAVGLTQAELARRAKVRPETLNRIEKAKVTADTATVVKITRALEQVERGSRRG